MEAVKQVKIRGQWALQGLIENPLVYNIKKIWHVLHFSCIWVKAAYASNTLADSGEIKVIL